MLTEGPKVKDIATTRNASATLYFVRHGKTQFNQQHRVQGWCDSPLTEEGVDSARAAGRELARIEFKAAYASDLGRTRQTLAELLDARAQARSDVDEPRECDPAPTLQPHASDAASPSTPRAARFLSALDEAAKTSSTAVLEGVAARCDARLREWCYGNLEGGSGEKLHERLIEGFGRELTFAEENERLPETADNLARLDPTQRAERFADIAKRLKSFLLDAGNALLAADGGNAICTTHAFAIRTLMYLLDRTRVNDPLVILNGSITRVVYDGTRFTLEETGVLQLPESIS